jgi:SAM-dependent methyltransferase
LRWWNFSSVDVSALYGPQYFSGVNGNGYDDYYAQRPAIERTSRRRLGKIDQVLGVERGRLLDLGCGPGFFLDVARSAGWTVQGVEISESASQFARESLKLDVVNLPIGAQGLPCSNVDLVTMWDVIEHLPDPRGALDAAHRVLRPGGGLVLTTGDVDSVAARLSGERWHLYNLPEHLYFHTERSIRTLAERAGFRAVSVQRHAMIVSLSYAVERITHSYLNGVGRRLGHWLPRMTIPATLHDVMTLYAVRA